MSGWGQQGVCPQSPQLTAPEPDACNEQPQATGTRIARFRFEICYLIGKGRRPAEKKLPSNSNSVMPSPTREME